MNKSTILKDFNFKIVSLIHDNRLRRRFNNPEITLKSAGIQPGQKVLEVGCGPGFFTIPTAKLVGNEGFVYAVDIHPLAIETVQKKIDSKEIKNVRLMLTNAANTGLSDQSIDLVFMFGLPYLIGGQGSVISEIHRILKPGGILSIMKTWRSEEKLIEDIEMRGFIHSRKQARIFLFRKG